MNDPISAGLLEIAGPQLYRRNAFRITGLPTDADRRTVRHRQQKIIPALEMGIELDLGHSLPVEPDDVRRAFDLILGDPRRRLVDELFWLWDTPEATCGCVKALHTDHDQAVQAHSAALDKESLGDSLTDDELDELETLWAEASRLWNNALRRAAFWDHVRHRITTLDDKQLNESVVDLLRDELPITLVKPLIQLAASSTSEPTWLAEQARTWPLPTVVVDDQLEAAAEPIYESVKTDLSEAVKPLEAGDPHTAASMLYDKVLPQLKRLNALVPATRHRRTASIRNDVAIVFNNCAIKLIDDIGPDAERAARKWFSAARKLTSDEHTLALLDQNTTTLNDIVDAFKTIRQRVEEFRAYGRTDLARQMLRNIRREMAGQTGVNAIDIMLADLGDHSPARREQAYERILERHAARELRRHSPAGRRQRIITWLIVLGVLFLVIYLLFIDSASATPVQLHAQKSRDNAPVGTCVESKDGWEGPKSEVPSVPCDAEHWGEVVGYVSLAVPGPSPYPGDDQIAAQARFNCFYMKALKGYEDQYTVDSVSTIGAEWNDGKNSAFADADNYATCVLHREDDEPLPDRQLGKPESGTYAVWHMDLLTPDIQKNPPVGACVHTRQSFDLNVHNVEFTTCDTEHWGEVIGYPVLYDRADPWPGDSVIYAAAQAACRKTAIDRGLDAKYSYSTVWPGQDVWNYRDNNHGLVKKFAACVASYANGSALKGQLK